MDLTFVLHFDDSVLGGCGFFPLGEWKEKVWIVTRRTLSVFTALLPSLVSSLN